MKNAVRRACRRGQPPLSFPSSGDPRWAFFLGTSFGLVVLATMISRAILGVSVHDQAEQVVFAQDWRLSYDEQMPVLQWIANGALRATRFSVLTPDLLKFAGVGAAVAAMFVTGRRLTGSGVGGALAALLMFLLPTIHQDILREFPHTAALTGLFGLSTVYFVRRPGEDRPSLRPWWGLALIWAGGIFAKHNMVLFVIAQAVAYGVVFRPAGVERGQLLKALALAGALTAPVYAILLSRVGQVRQGTAEFIDEQSALARLEGLGDLLLSVPGEAAALIVVGTFALFSARRRGGDNFPPEIRFFFLFLAVVSALFAVTVVAANAAIFKDRWIGPALIVLGPVAAYWLSRGLPPRWIERLAGSLCAGLVIVGIVRAVEPGLDGRRGRIGEENLPLPAMVARIAAHAGGADLVLVANEAVGATLKTRRPAIRVHSPKTVRLIPADAETLLLVTSDRTPRPSFSFPQGVWRCGPPERFAAPYRFGPKGSFGYAIQHCRRRQAGTVAPVSPPASPG